MKVRHQPIDDAKAIRRPNEDARLRLARANRPVGLGRALERAHARRAHRPHLSARPRDANESSRAVSGAIEYHSSCIGCAAGSSTSTGLNVPAPTCRRTSARATPRDSSAAEQLGREMQPCRGRSDRP